MIVKRIYKYSLIVYFIASLGYFYYSQSYIKKVDAIIPELEQRIKEIETPIQVVEVVNASNVLDKWAGEASYYYTGDSTNTGITMANGQPLDDSVPTVAFNHAPLGTKLKIRNLANGMEVIAEVTDRGGFNKRGRRISNIEGDNNLERVADLNVATKEAIKCNSLCQVEIIEL